MQSIHHFHSSRQSMFFKKILWPPHPNIYLISLPLVCDYCKIEQRLEISKISNSYFSYLDLVVDIIKAISDVLFAKMMQGNIWRGRKESKGERGRITTYFKSPICVEVETTPRPGFGYRLTGLSAHELAEHSLGSCRRRQRCFDACHSSLQRLPPTYIFPTSSHHILTPRYHNTLLQILVVQNTYAKMSSSLCSDLPLANTRQLLLISI